MNKPMSCEPLVQPIQDLRRSVECINDIKDGNGCIADLASKIKERIKNQLLEPFEYEGINLEVEISDNKYYIKFKDTDKSRKEDLKAWEGCKLIVKKVGDDYKFGAEFGEGDNAFCIGEFNGKFPFRSQVSAFEGLQKNLILIATATGSGKTITKLMFALGAKLDGIKVVSVNPRQDLVEQEYEDQQEAVSYNKVQHISHRNQYDETANHNILSLDRFFCSSKNIIDLSKLAELIRKHEAQNEGFKVDLNNQRVIIGNIKIYQDHYKVNEKMEQGSLFEEQKLLVILDEVQDIVNQGETYYSYIKLLLLLAKWEKIKLVIATATPPIWMKEFIEKAGGKIEAQSLKEKIRSGVGSRIDVTVHANKKDKDFIEICERDLTSEVLERSEAEKKWYKTSKESDVKKKIREHIQWNLQSPLNRMTLACFDSEESKKAFEERVESPEKQFVNGRSISLTQSKSALHDKIKEKLVKKFRDDKKEDIDSVLNEFDLTSSMTESGVFAVAHGFIDNVISCITGISLDDLSKKRFSDLDELVQQVKGKVGNCGRDEITGYVDILGLNDSNRREVIKGMEIVLKLFQEYNNEKNEKLEELVSNHNLSNTIHKMLLPNFQELSQGERGFTSNAYLSFDKIHEHTKHIDFYDKILRSGIFDYLRSYGIEIKKEKQNNLEGLNKKLAKAVEALLNTKKELDPKISKINGEISNIQNNLSDNIGEYQKKINLLEKECKNYKKELEAKENEFKKCKVEFLDGLKLITEYVLDADKHPLYKLREICNQFAICKKESEEVCDEDKLSKAGLIGYYFNNHRKSGFNNTVLHNVIMRETTEDNLENKKQCVGRPGRKAGPIISLSYVDSSKIGNPQETKDLLENGSPFSSTVKKKINVNEVAAVEIRKLEEIINSCKNAEDVQQKVLEWLEMIYNEIHVQSQYDGKRAYSIFKDVLTKVKSHLKYKCNKEGTIVGDSGLKVSIKSIESRIETIADRIANLSEKIDDLINQKDAFNKELDKFNEKLKIKGNIVKRLIVEIYTLLLQLWHFRCQPTQKDVDDVLTKVDTSTAKERVVLKRGRDEVRKKLNSKAKELDSQMKAKNKVEEEKISLIGKKQKYQNEYNKMHSYVGVVEQKAGVTQQNFESIKDALVKKQRDGINEELQKALKAFSELRKKYDKDLEGFKFLKENKIDALFLSVDQLREKFKASIEAQEKLQKLKQEVELIKGKLENSEGSYLYEFHDKFQIIVEKAGKIESLIQDLPFDDYEACFSKSEFSKIQKNIKAKEVVSFIFGRVDCNKTKESLELMLQSLNELIAHVVTLETDDIQATLEKAKENIGQYKGKTRIESLYDIVVKLVSELENKEVSTINAKKRFLKSCDDLEDEKKLLEKVKSEHDELKKEIDDLEDEKREWESNPSGNLCKNLFVYNSINECYTSKSALWCFQVLPKFITAFPSHACKERMQYISSPVFLELFTNIIMPLMNNGTLEIALSILDSSKISDAQRSVGLINDFYDKLTNMKYGEIDEKEIDNALQSMQVLYLFIAAVKLNHYANGFKRDLTLLKSLTCGKVDLQYIIKNMFGKQQPSSISNPQGPGVITPIIMQHLQQKKEDGLLKMMREINPMTHGIYAKDINSGTTILSTLNLALKVLPIIIAKRDNFFANLFKDTSVMRASKAIEDLTQLDMKKAAYDELNLCYDGLLQNDDKKTVWPKEELLTSEDQLNLEAQKYGERVRLARNHGLPADCILNPSLSKLNFVSLAALKDERVNLCCT